METIEQKLSELSAHVDGRVVGDGNVLIRRVASLDTAGEGDIAYVEDEKFFAAANSSGASCVFVPAGAAIDSECRIEVKNPKLAFALIAEILHPAARSEPSIHPSAIIDENADVALTAFIGANVCIG